MTVYLKGFRVTPMKIMTDGKFTDEYVKTLLEDEPDAGLGPVLKTVGTARCGDRALRLPPNTEE